MIFYVLFFIILFVLVVMALLLFLMYRMANMERVLVQDLYFEDLPKAVEDIKIFFISDIHRRVISHQLIETVRYRANMVIIGGDLIESTVPFTRVEQNILKLKEIGQMYFVWGNNDYNVDTKELESILLKHDVTILTNEAVSIKNGKITLLGIDDISMDRDRLDLALKQCEHTSSFRILISHNPLVKDQIHEDYHIRLILAGHTHGGQIRILGYGPYKLGGIEFIQNCMLFVSNGFGTSTVPLRLGAKPETHLLTLKRGYHTEFGERQEIRL